MKKNVTILAKNPFKGQVKTRLSRQIGADAARGVYARILYQTLCYLVAHDAPDTSITLSLPSHRDKKFFMEAYPELEISLQPKGNFGSIIYQALQKAFHDGAQQAVVIGSDLPAMHWELLTKAFNQMHEKSVILGPCQDGGYYLIGMQSPGVNVFQNIPWSSDQVLKMTYEKIRDLGYQPVLLPQHQDIDYESHLRAWQADLLKCCDQEHKPD